VCSEFSACGKRCGSRWNVTRFSVRCYLWSWIGVIPLSCGEFQSAALSSPTSSSRFYCSSPRSRHSPTTNLWHTHTQQKAEALVRTVLSYSLSLTFVLVFHKHPLFLPPSFFLLTPALSLSLSLSLAEVGVAAAGLLPVTQLYAVLIELLRDANTAWIFPVLHFPFHSSPPPATPSLLCVTPPTYQSAAFSWPLSKSLCTRDLFYFP